VRDRYDLDVHLSVEFVGVVRRNVDDVAARCPRQLAAHVLEGNSRRSAQQVLATDREF